jgi:ankyrin repeat protein
MRTQWYILLIFLHVAFVELAASSCSSLAKAIHNEKGMLRLRGGESEEDPTLAVKYKGNVHSASGRRMLSRRLRQASEKGKVVDMRLALADGADPRDVDLAGFTSLHLAAENGHIEAVALLLEKVS